MASGQIEFGLSQDILDILAENAVKKALPQTSETKSEQSEPNFMDRYDMTTKPPYPTWKDVISIPHDLAAFGLLYVRDLFTKKI